jgi:hypothetical protein
MERIVKFTNNLPVELRNKPLSKIALSRRLLAEEAHAQFITDALAAENDADILSVQSKGEMVLALKLAANIFLDKEIPNEPPTIPLESLLSEDGFNYILQNEDLPKITEIAGNRSTHAVKFGRNTGFSYNLFGRVEHKTFGVSSYDARHGRPFYSQGEAWNMRRQLIFGMLVQHKGEITSLYDLIASNNSDMRSALLELGVNESVVCDMVAAGAEKSIQPVTETAPENQLLWPDHQENGTRFISLSPSPSVRLYSSIKKEKEDAAKAYPWHKVRSTHLKCGGKKPQNMGGAVKKFEGNMPGLYAKVPKIQKLDKIEDRVGAGIKILRYRLPESEALHKKFTKRSQKAAYYNSCLVYVETLLMPLLEYRALLSENPNLPLPKDALEKRLVTAPFSHGEPEEVAGMMANTIVSKNQRKKAPFSPDMVEALVKALTKFLRAYFKD